MVHVAQSLVFCVDHCLSICLFAIALCGLRFSASDYPFGTFSLFLLHHETHKNVHLKVFMVQIIFVFLNRYHNTGTPLMTLALWVTVKYHTRIRGEKKVLIHKSQLIMMIDKHENISVAFSDQCLNVST